MALGKDLGRIWEGFWEDFGRILGGFWKDFGRILGVGYVMRFWMASGRLLEALGWILGNKNENIYRWRRLVGGRRGV